MFAPSTLPSLVRPRTWVCALSLLAAAGASQAQTSPQAPATKPTAAASPAQAASPSQPSIKRWVDERGVVHYGDAAPARSAGPVTEVNPVPSVVTDEQTRAQAQSRLDSYREQMARPPAQPQAASASAPVTPPAPTGPAPNDQSCLAQWQRYDAAYACLDGQRASGGIVRPEALQQCPVLKQPDCPLPPGMVRR